MQEANIKLSFPFIYSKEKLNSPIQKDAYKEIGIAENHHPENLLSYVDRLYSKNRVCRYKNFPTNMQLYNHNKNEMFLLDIEEITINFYTDNIAFLNIWFKVQFSTLEELYKINKYITSIYTKTSASNQVFVHLGNQSSLKIKIKKEEFQKRYLEYFKKDDRVAIEKLLQSDKAHEKVLLHEIEFKKYTNDNQEFIEISKLNSSAISKKILNRYSQEHLSFYSPYQEGKKDYPFSPSDRDEEKIFKGRVGFNETEKLKIQEMNKKFNGEKIDEKINQHYIYFENQLKIFENKKKFIHYDTFITSLILEFVKLNSGYMFYDNFNPLATSYLNNYIVLEIDNTTLKQEMQQNYISYEPLISIKTNRGTTIDSMDYFEAFQSQTDIATIGNSHSIVHLIGAQNKSIVNNKLTSHYFTYQLTLFQRVKILNIINQTILNNDAKRYFEKMLKSYKNMRAINNQIDEYKKYLTNYNFSVISNSASVDASYKFFRACNNIDKLTNQWNTISYKFGDIEDIFSHTFGFIAIIILTLPLLYAYGKNFWEFIEWFLNLF